MTKKQKGFWNRFVEFSAMQTAMLHAMPTYFRKNDDEYIDPKEKSSMMECAGAIYGGILGMTLFTGEVISYRTGSSRRTFINTSNNKYTIFNI